MASVDVIIVNYRSTQLAIACLESLNRIRSEADQLHVSLVENSSPDDSLERLRSAIAERVWQGWVEIMPSRRNGGFAYGNNFALKKGNTSFDCFRACVAERISRCTSEATSWDMP